MLRNNHAGFHTALDRILGSPTVPNIRTKSTWSEIRRLLRRQCTRPKLMESLKRLIEEPDVPISVIDYALNRIDISHQGEEGGTIKHSKDSDREDLVSGIRCIRNIWHRLLVERNAVANYTYASMTTDTRHEVQGDIMNEMLEIQDLPSFQSNELFYNAFQKTKLILQRLCQESEGCHDFSFVSLIMIHQLPPFLLWLAVAEDSECYVRPHHHNEMSSLPLHQAMRASNMCIVSTKTRGSIGYNNNYHWIFFSKEKLHGWGEEKEEEEQQQRDGGGWEERSKILDLFNLRSPIQLLCHLAPQACRIGLPSQLPSSSSSSSPSSSSSSTTTASATETEIEAATSIASPSTTETEAATETEIESSNKDSWDNPWVALDVFLSTLSSERHRIETDWKFHPSFTPNIQDLLMDIHAIVARVPQVLERRNPDTRLFPFCMPQLQPEESSSTDPKGGSCSSPDTECFLLTLAYDLLIQNPSLVSRHLYPNNPLQPQTAYEKILKDRIQNEKMQRRKLLEKRESLKRRITELEEVYGASFFDGTHSESPRKNKQIRPR